MSGITDDVGVLDVESVDVGVGVEVIERVCVVVGVGVDVIDEVGDDEDVGV